VRGRTGVWIARVTLAVYWGLAAAGYLLRGLNDAAFAAGDELYYRVVWGGWPTVGAVIVARQPRNRIGWLCCAVGLLVGPASFAQAYAWYALVHRPASLPGGLAMAWLGEWPWFVALGLVLTFLLLLFPNGHLASRRWRVVAWAAAVDLALVWVVAAFKPGPLEGLIGISNPLGIQSVEAAFNLLGAVVAPVLGVLTILSAASMVVRFRRTRGVERQQLKWFTYAAVLSVLAWLVFALTGLQEQLPSALEYMVGAIFLAGVPVAIGIALLRYHLYDIDRLIRRTLVYGVLSALLGAVYAGTVLLLGQLFGGIGAEPPSWVVAGATLAVAALFGPARHRVQQVVDRRFNRRRYDAAKTIEGFSVRLRDQVDLDTLTAELLAVVDQTVEPTKATLWLRPGGSRAAPQPRRVGR
jgi:energy-converting hydrogenase Eha subunit A